jgi:hypothetical protein
LHRFFPAAMHLTFSTLLAYQSHAFTLYAVIRLFQNFQKSFILGHIFVSFVTDTNSYKIGQHFLAKKLQHFCFRTSFKVSAHPCTSICTKNKGPTQLWNPCHSCIFCVPFCLVDLLEEQKLHWLSSSRCGLVVMRVGSWS